MAANKTDSKQLHDRLLASGAQPLVGLVTPHPPDRENDEIDLIDDDDEHEHDIQTYSVSLIRRQETSTSSRRSILKNRGGYSEQVHSDNENHYNSKWSTPNDNNNHEFEPMLMKVPIIASSHHPETKTIASKIYTPTINTPQQERSKPTVGHQQRQPQERVILIEKDYTDIETPNRKNSIPRSQSRISWNLEEEDNHQESRAKELSIERQSSATTQAKEEDRENDMVPTRANYKIKSSSVPSDGINQRNLTSAQNQTSTHLDYRQPVDDTLMNFEQNGQQFRHKHEHDISKNLTTLDLDPEPVYVCRCCGLAFELTPNMRHLHTFRMIFFIFNFLVLLFGVATLGMGLWYRIDPKVYELHKYIETQNFTIAGWIMLFAGFTVIITTLVGFIGATRSKPGYLIYYFIIVAIVTLLFMSSLVLVTVYGLGESLERFATKEVFQQIQQKPFSDTSAQFLDFLQVKLKCCGATSFTDYARLGMNPPISCSAIARNYINAPGCGRAFRELFDIRAGMAVGFLTGAILVQLVAITMAAMMFCIIYHSRISATSQDTNSHIAN